MILRTIGVLAGLALIYAGAKIWPTDIVRGVIGAMIGVAIFYVSVRSD